MRDVILALFVFGMLPVVVVRPFIGLLLWSWMGYMNPNRLCYGFAITFPWVQLIAVVTLLSFLVSRERKSVPRLPISVLMVIFLLWTGVTTFFAVVPDSARDAWMEFGKTLLMVLVTLALVNSRQRAHWIVWTIVVSLGYYGMRGGLFTMLSGGVNHVIGPPASSIADNNALALALCMTLPLMRYLQLHSARKFIRLGLALAMLLTGIAVLGTYSRGGLIALTVVSGALFFKGRGRFAILLIAVVLGATAYHFMPTQWAQRMGTLQDATKTGSGETRIESYKFAANVAVHRPVLGGGFNVYLSIPMWDQYGPEGATPRAIHSIYFRVLGEHGFPGLVLFLGLLYLSWRTCSRIRKRTRFAPEGKWAFDLASMLQVSLVAFMTAGAFLPMPYFDLPYQLMALCAMLDLLTRQPANHPVSQVVAGRMALPTRPNPSLVLK
jgi:probable O-glycosylation ligase (exosortase A-associated)